MIRAIKDLPRALHALVAALARLADLLHSDLELREAQGDLGSRLEALERSRALWEGEMEAAMVKVESRNNAARAAEERTRRLTEGKDGRASEGDEEGADPFEDYVRLLRESDAEGGGEEGLHAMPGGVGPPLSVKDRLRAQKLGFPG